MLVRLSELISPDILILIPRRKPWDLWSKQFVYLEAEKLQWNLCCDTTNQGTFMWINLYIQLSAPFVECLKIAKENEEEFSLN